MTHKTTRQCACTHTNTKQDSLLWQKFQFIVFQASDLWWSEFTQQSVWVNWRHEQNDLSQIIHGDEQELIILWERKHIARSLRLCCSTTKMKNEIPCCCFSQMWEWRGEWYLSLQSIEDKSLKMWSHGKITARGIEGKFPIWCFCTLIDKVNADMFT